MTDPTELRQFARILLKEMGFPLKSADSTINQNQASKILTRSKVERGMKDGSIRWTKENMNSDHCPVRVNRSDVMKLLNK